MRPVGGEFAGSSVVFSRWHGLEVAVSPAWTHVRFGSDSEVTASPRHDRFPPGSGHPSVPERGQLRPEAEIDESANKAAPQPTAAG
jgi:hypothetical protein